MYEEIEVELIRFEAMDVITQSPDGTEEDEIGDGPIK